MAEGRQLEWRERRLATRTAAGATERPAGEARRRDDDAPSLFESPRRVAVTALVVLLLFAAIYVLLPKLIGLEDAIAKMGEGQWQWFAVAVGFNVLAFGSYVALFRGVIGEKLVHLDWRESYQITMAGLAASRVLSAGGAGGVVLSYWALRKAGMRRAEAAERMVAFLVLLYAFYVVAVIVFGILLRTGVLPGPAPLSMTIIPAAIAGGVAIVFLLIMLVPGDLRDRISLDGGNRASRAILKLSQVPATISTGTRLAYGFVREPRKGGLASLGAAGFWASNIGILWATFMAFGVSLPIAVLVVGFFVGMAANLAPDPAGVGAVDGGLIGSFVIFGESASTVIAAVLVYRLIAFWMPLPPGIVAFLQLRRTVARWEAEGRSVDDDGTGRPEALPAAANRNTSVSEVRSGRARCKEPEEPAVTDKRLENLIIVGGACAGYTAAIYAARADLEPLVIEGFQWGGQLQNTTEVENYPGFPDGIMGPELMNRFRAQAERFGTRFITDDATGVELTDGGIQIVRVGDDEYRARTVILAMGAQPKRLGLPGEMELAGRGVSTCGVCDGAFFKGRDVVVIGGGDTAMEDAMFVAKYADRLTVLHRRRELRASMVMQDRAREVENIEFKTPYVPEEFVAGADGALDHVRIRHAESGETEELEVGGAFVAIGHIPGSELVAGQVDLHDNGYVRVAEPSTRTSLAGVFAVGDLVDFTYRQAVTAAGSGTRGALDAEWYLRDTPPTDAERIEQAEEAGVHG